MKFQVEIQSQKVIKPCTPTPPHLRSYKISIIDELNPSMHVIRILYYPHDASMNDGKLLNMEESLARILSLLYPLAGRYVKTSISSIAMTRAPIEYSHARIDCDLQTLIGDPNVGSDEFNRLLPLEIGEADEPTNPMMAVRINRFQCGGLAIGVCVSHRISDSCSMGILLSAWADAVNRRLESVVRPDFDSPLFFPGENLDPLAFGVSRTRDTSIVCKRFVFDSVEIKAHLECSRIGPSV